MSALSKCVAISLAFLACASTDSIETVPVEKVQRIYVLDAGPCEYQGTLHRSLRFELDRDLKEKKVSLDEWTCLAHSLERMDKGLREACVRGETEARAVLLRREDESAKCLSDPASHSL